MGVPMATNLLKAGHSITVHDLLPDAVAKLTEAGATRGDDPAAVAEAVEIVLTSLPTPAVVEAVYLGERGLIEGARQGQLFVDLSSISPFLAKQIASRFVEKGAIFLDAPVSGGVLGAKAATLAVMVGGDPEGFQRAEPVLKVIGKNVFHVGQVGTSSTIKILNQLLVGVTASAVAEMINLARRAGMDMNQVREVISASSGWSKIFDTEFPKTMARDFDTGFAVDLIAKDLRLARDLGKELGTELPVAGKALEVFEKASNAGLGRKDMGAAIQLYEQQA